MLAAYTGLWRGEIQKLTWDDLHLDEARPYILARASTTKNKKITVLRLVLPLVTTLKAWRATKLNLSGKVFRLGVPAAKSLLKDLAACGIEGRTNMAVNWTFMRYGTRLPRCWRGQGFRHVWRWN